MYSTSIVSIVHKMLNLTTLRSLLLYYSADKRIQFRGLNTIILRICVFCRTSVSIQPHARIYHHNSISGALGLLPFRHNTTCRLRYHIKCAFESPSLVCASLRCLYTIQLTLRSNTSLALLTFYDCH